MHIEDLFEDLEAQFASASVTQTKSSFTSGAKIVEAQLANTATRKLIAPIIGQDFIAGLDLVSPIWYLYPVARVRKLRFCDSSESDLPAVRNFEVSLEQFLGSAPKPCAIRWCTIQDQHHLAIGQLHSLSGGLMFIYQSGVAGPIAVPVAALEMMAIESVDNLNGSF
ncbi:MAG: hypothetical protein RLY13_461 [Actinomycetota bacterium]|jgi:hypothetical protein